MLEDADLSRWFDNVARGAMSTADVYVRRLSAVCRRLGIDPHDLIDLEKGERFNLILDFVGGEEKRGMSGSYIRSSLKAIKSWLAHNGISIERKIKIRNENRTPTIEDEVVPTKKELHKIFLAGNLRARICSAFMAHSGVRPGVLGHYRGDDGLTIGDLPEMRIEGDEVVFDKIPTRVDVRAELSKSDKKYITFLSTQGCEYLKLYLESRINDGETLEGGTDVITPKWADKKFIRSINIGDIIRKAIRKAGFDWRPYVLRAYCDTQLLLAESKGEMTHAYRQFFMGHVGDIDARYTTNKGRLPEELIEDMREAYAKSEKFLQTTEEHEEKKNVEFSIKRQMLKMAGVGEEEIDDMDLEETTEEEIMEILRRKLMGMVTGNGAGQKVIPLPELSRYMEEGWEYVDQLPNDQVVVKLPS